MDHSDRKYSIVKNPDDVESIIPLLKEFVAEAGETDVDYVYVTALVQHMLQDPGSVILGLYKGDRLIGVIGGILVPALLNPSRRILNELTWFVTKGERNSMWNLRLISEFEEEAEKLGANSINMSLRSSSEVATLAALYERKGYTLQETVYSRRLN